MQCRYSNRSGPHIIGVSLSKPHTSCTSMHLRYLYVIVYNYICCVRPPVYDRGLKMYFAYSTLHTYIHHLLTYVTTLHTSLFRGRGRILSTCTIYDIYVDVYPVIVTCLLPLRRDADYLTWKINVFHPYEPPKQRVRREREKTLTSAGTSKSPPCL